jgi:SAM-dependent methyltransferase
VDVIALVEVVAAVLGTAAAVAGVIVAVKQLRVMRADSARETSAGGALELLGEPAVFSPGARYLGYDVGMVDRHAESATLLRAVRAGKSVIAVEGMAGAGKSTVAAHVCRRAGRLPVLARMASFRPGWDVRWVFCGERARSLTLTALGAALASDAEGTPVARALRAVAARGAEPAEFTDALIDLLAGRRILLVLDDFHTVTDPALRQLLSRLEHSQIASSVIVTSRSRLPELHATALAQRMTLGGMSLEDSRALLRTHEITLRDASAKLVWERAGGGNPFALTMFAGRARDTDPEGLVQDLPAFAKDTNAWIAPVFDVLSPAAQQAAKITAFAYEAPSRELVAAVAPPGTAEAALAELASRFLATVNAGQVEMNSAVRDFVSGRTTPAEQDDLAQQFTSYYQDQAREVFVHGLGHHEPSYGLLYLESFPDYICDTERHITFVDDLISRLADSGYELKRGAKILVLGSGHGTHDPGFAKHGLDVTNVDIQPEIASLGADQAASLPAEIRYVVADMTQPLPEVIAPSSMDAVFNIGSSFGYEAADDANAAVFRQAARSLRVGAPFVFEYVNGPHWEGKRVQHQVDVTRLPNGSTRTEVSIDNPQARTSLTMIGLQRADGSRGWFSHFMHYYGPGEIRSMMALAGLRPVAVYGARSGRVTGEPFDEGTSEAMVVIAERDAAGG